MTVCQHIKLKEFVHLFEEARISDIFWTHATGDDLATRRRDGIALHPFPLYPVQVPNETDPDATAERPFLFSFIGARSNKYYLTNARELILDLLSDHPKGLIIGRDSWHYNKVVYEHQIRKNGALGDRKEDLVYQSASEQFKASLAQSLFSLCPSGTGPNSIRLWESLGAGSIPVILAETYAPPGNPALWEQAAVFCDETEAAITALPQRLEAIASDPERIARMRHAMRQLWLLYGPQTFVSDIQEAMLRHAGQADTDDHAMDTTPFSLRLTRSLSATSPMPPSEAMQLLRACSGDLLLDGLDALGGLGDDTAFGQFLVLAQDSLGANHPHVRHYRDVFDHVRSHRSGPLCAPGVARTPVPRICLFGEHSNRTPLAYAPLRKTAGGRIAIVTDPMAADVVMTGFNIDIRNNPEIFGALARTGRDTKVVVVSEEPLWDSIWSGGVIERERVATCGDAELSYTLLNHSNSGIFDFDAIPYFLLTSESFLSRYALLIAKHAQREPARLLEHWRQAPVSAAFYAEVRDTERYKTSFPEQHLYGLSVYRTEIARQVDLAHVLRVGKGWQEGVRRQDLPDWHLDKLAALDGRTCIVSAYENTHQRSYISEKIFDAFAVGGIPTYFADPGHRVLKLVPNGSMVNTWGQSAESAAQGLSEFEPDMAMAESWLETARKLQVSFTDLSLVARERQRVVDALLLELERL